MPDCDWRDWSRISRRTDNSVSHWFSGPVVLIRDCGYEELDMSIGLFQHLRERRWECFLQDPRAGRSDGRL